MRLHENENNEVDELQRLRARRQGTSRSRRSTSSRTEFKTVPKQAKAIDHTYDEDYYEEEDYDYDDYREESVRSGLEVPFENENHSRVISAGSYQSRQKNPDYHFPNNYSAQQPFPLNYWDEWNIHMSGRPGTSYYIGMLHHPQQLWNSFDSTTFEPSFFATEISLSVKTLFLTVALSRPAEINKFLSYTLKVLL